MNLVYKVFKSVLGVNTSTSIFAVDNELGEIQVHVP